MDARPILAAAMTAPAPPYPPRPITADALAKAVERHRGWLEEARGLGIITEQRSYADLDGEHVAGEVGQAWMQSDGRLWMDGLSLVGEGRAQLGDAELDGARFRGARLRGASFFQARLQRAWFGDADLEGAHFGGADLRRAQLQRANLRGAYLSRTRLDTANLKGANLTEANLEGAAMRGADLTGAVLTGADLRDTDLEGATLEGTSWGAARLRNASLRGADLRHADLREVIGLQADQLAGAQVSGARLPVDLHGFDAPLKHVEEASSSAQKLFVMVLLACLYSLLTIATTTDARLLTNTASSPLPILGTEVPIVSFHLVAPVLLLGLYLYFHLYLQRLWEGLASLPAVFPDGRALDRKAYPWLLGGLVRAHVRLLRGDRPALSRLQTAAALATAWWAVPVTLLAFWGRGLPRHDWGLTAIHVLLLGAAVGAALAFQRLMRATLRHQGAPRPGQRWWRPAADRARAPAAAFAGVAVLAGAVSWGTIEGVEATGHGLAAGVAGLARPAPYDPRGLVPEVLSRLRYRSFLALEREDVSGRAPGDAPLAAVRPAALTGRDLRRARARGAFLARAELAGADLRGADLREADLRGANLGQTNWSYFWRDRALAFMPLGDTHRSADLRLARLMRADLRGAILQGADLRGADLRLADLREAVLVGADLRGATLHLADLRDAHLRAARLNGAGLAQAALGRADLREADLQGADLGGADLGGAHLACAILRGATLAGASGLSAEQIRAARRDETTRLPADLAATVVPDGASEASCREPR
jgi:uncharacterized protein YjbI with pentapeptide repeats